MGLRLTCAVLALLVVGCVQPSFTKCPEVDCPKDFVCDGQGGCALPAQLAQCSSKENGDSCSYVDSRSNTIDGACSNSICLPIGCGNTIVTPNEVCDDGNTVNGDGCSADCQSNETCGNGAVDPASGEQCDDGNAEAGDSCQPDCKNPRCGDSIIDVSLNEACDGGAANSLAPDATCRPSCQFPRCGDGVIDPSNAEICDDNNNNPNDGCAGDCKSDETCGNNVVDVLAGEVCDDGNIQSNDGCRNDCKSTEACGNNVMDTARGEVCDDGNIVSGDGCSSDCRSLEVCGNNVLDTIDEECDLGTSNSNLPDSMCRTTCKLPMCGDDILDPMRNEQCDDGMMNANVADACRTSCQLPRCGDTIKDMAEACDDGNYLSGDGCSGDCRSAETCGNSYIDTATGEQCDAGAMNSNLANAACRTNCRLPRCGDMAIDTTLGEACDAGTANSQSPNAACRTNCQPRRCGDTIIDSASGEVCDDGNTTSGDNCSADCKSIESCGNGILDAAKGEQCDAGASNSNLANAPCRTDCKLPRCGDSAVDTTRGETCDAGASNSQSPNAACRTNCQLRRCGDTIIDNLSMEVCDDGNAVANDGCSVDCKSIETCGNGIVDVSKGEQCDAGLNNSAAANAPCRTNCQFPSCGDGATDTTRGEACDAGAANSNLANASCRTNCQPQRCGDNIFDNTKGEVCDDGNIASGDNCSADCKSLETCPNGIVDTAKGEKCDDGNGINNDFCHNNCTLPTCGDSIVDFNEQCDNGAANSNSANAACRPTCLLRRCGDGINDNMNGEVCDDGNLAFGDGCTPDCKSNETCGNAIVDITVGEQCDDGNGRGRDGCSACKGEDAVVLSTGINLQYLSQITMAYDAGRKRVVMVSYGTTYEFDGVTWTQMNPRKSPGSRTAPGLAYDPIRKRVVLFGGYYNNYMADTWEWDGTDWVDRQPANAPSPRYYTNMQFDPNRNKIVLYGGFISTGASDETWEWDGTNWAKITTVGATPGQKCGHSMAFDAARKEMVLYGGGCSGTSMWTFNGTTSTWTSKGIQSIPATYFQYMAYDPNRAAVVLWVTPQVTYEWNGMAWSSIAGATPINNTSFGNANYGAMVYDAARAQLVLAGGYACPMVSGSCVYPGTWTRTGSTWAALPAFVQPSSRRRAAAAYDPTRGKVVLFGGIPSCMYCSQPALNDTWEWDGRRWAPIAASTPPAIRGGQWADFNTTTRTVTMFGGSSYDSLSGLRTHYADLYSYNGSAWSPAAMSTGRTGVWNSAMAYHAANNSVVTFGGYDPNRTALSQTWVWTSTVGWLMSGATGPAARQNHVMGYDPIRQRTILFSGVSGNTLADTWEWNGTAWVAGASGPLGRKGSALYFNPDIGKMNLFGNNNQGTGGEDLWEYGAATGAATWTQRPVANAPSQNYRGATAYDAARHQAIVFGGSNYSGQTRLIRYRSFVTPESCTFSTLDYDKDGLAGCADPDCWSVCTPMCAPGSAASCGTSISPRCGNGTCDPLEDCDICPSDCTTGCPAQLCGDFRCNGSENRTTCPADCP